MAELNEVMLALANLVSGAVAGTSISAAVIGTEWPSENLRTDAGVSGNPPLIAVIEKLATFQDRGMTFDHSITQTEKSILATFSDNHLASGQSATVTISYNTGHSSINAGDLISANFLNGDLDSAATVNVIAGDTLSTLATKLATAINALALSGLTAAAVGAVVTVSFTGSGGYNISSNSGNTITVKKATKWATRNMQINAYSNNLDMRDQSAIILNDLLAQIDENQGFPLPSGEWIDLNFRGAKPGDADVDKDVYLYYFLFDVEHWLDVTDQRFSVVAALRQTLP